MKSSAMVESHNLNLTAVISKAKNQRSDVGGLLGSDDESQHFSVTAEGRTADSSATAGPKDLKR